MKVLEPVYMKMLDETSKELYMKACKERHPTEAERPLYALYAFYCSRLCRLLSGNPDDCVSGTAKALLEAVLAISMQLDIPSEISEWAL